MTDDTEDITIEEAKRRRAGKRRAAAPKANGSDPDDHKRKLKVYRLPDLGDVEQPNKLVAGVMGENQLAMLFGPSGAGKSFVAFDLAMHIALCGLDPRFATWMGHQVSGGSALYIAAEGRGGWPNRRDAFCRLRGVDEELRAMAPIGFVLDRINLGPREWKLDADAISRAIEALALDCQRACKLVVIDTLSRAMPGGSDADSIDAGAFVEAIDVIRDRTGATVMPVHHAGKNLTLGARGHTSIKAAMDTELEVTARDWARYLKISKSRDGEDGVEHAFQLQRIELAEIEGQTITSCAVVHEPEQADAAPGTKRRKLSRWQLALTVLADCIVDYPEQVRGNRYPSNRTLTKLDRFRAELEARSIIDADTDGTRRKQWFDVKRRLQEESKMAIGGDYCWIVEK